MKEEKEHESTPPLDQRSKSALQPIRASANDQSKFLPGRARPCNVDLSLTCNTKRKEFEFQKKVNLNGQEHLFGKRGSRWSRIYLKGQAVESG